MRDLRLMWAYIQFNMAAHMEYRVSFLLQTLGMALNNSAFIFFWWILFENVSRIGGYGFKDVMLLWSLCSTSFGLAFIVFGNVNQLTRLILAGELDSFLLQPKDVLMNVLCSKSTVSAWGDLAYGVLLFCAIAISQHGVADIWLYVGLYVVFSLCAALIFTSVLTIVHTLSFYLGDFSAVANLVTEFMITFSIYPDGIFTQWLRSLLYTLLPIGFLVYIPSQALVRPSFGALAMVVGACGAWVGLAYFAFYRGLKRYESGNLMGVKA